MYNGGVDGRRLRAQSRLKDGLDRIERIITSCKVEEKTALEQSFKKEVTRMKTEVSNIQKKLTGISIQ